jgi:myo-inositol-1(or 4)-monophosphatase
MSYPRSAETLRRIHEALLGAEQAFDRFTPGAIAAEYKAGHDPVTEADRVVDALLRSHLLREDEGWLSEESADDLSRLQKRRVWIVDPLDGTREFIAGIPEFAVAVALVEDGRPIAGGVCNPATHEMFLGSVGSGVTYNGQPACPSARTNLQEALILASRSEMRHGRWKRFEQAGLRIRPLGSIAYKLALVSVGLADATFTLTTKHEWDVAAGAALVLSAGGFVATLENSDLLCNHPSPRLAGLLASNSHLREQLVDLVRGERPGQPA